MDDLTLAAGMRALKGQCCTLSHQREVADEARRRGFMRFNEWPSGHWKLTDKGANFLSETGQ